MNKLTLYVDGEGHLFDENDEIFTLTGAGNPYGKIYQDKSCFACLKPSGAEVQCTFCLHKSCKDCTMKRRQYPAQPPPETPDKQANEDEDDDDFDGDALVKGIICKVCERKFQMNIFWHNHVPPLEESQNLIKEAYTKQHRLKLAEYEKLRNETLLLNKELKQLST